MAAFVSALSYNMEVSALVALGRLGCRQHHPPLLKPDSPESQGDVCDNDRVQVTAATSVDIVSFDLFYDNFWNAFSRPGFADLSVTYS